MRPYGRRRRRANKDDEQATKKEQEHMKRQVLRTIVRAAGATTLMAGLSGTALAAGGQGQTNGAVPGTPQSGTSAPTTNGAAARSMRGGPGGPGGKHGHGHGGGPGGLGGPGRGGKGGHGLVVTAVSGATITAVTHAMTETIGVSATTVYTEAGGAGAFSDITPGTRIHVVGTANGAGVVNATGIVIDLPRVRGVVTAINGSALTVTRMGRGPREGQPGGSPSAGTETTSATATTPATATTVIVTGNTTYTRAGQTASLSGISTGTTIDAEGTLNSDGSLTARRVTIALPRVDGQVTAKGNGSFSVTTPAGTKTVGVTSTTVYTAGPALASASSGAPSFNSVTVGARVHAEGTLNSDGSLTALLIRIGGPGRQGSRGPKDGSAGATAPSTSSSPTATTGTTGATS